MTGSRSLALPRLLAFLTLLVLMPSASGCSQSQVAEPELQESAETAQPAPMQRYILSVARGKDPKALRSNLREVVQVLEADSAVKVERSGERTLFVTCTENTLAKAKATGLLEAVQIDGLSKPLR